MTDIATEIANIQAIPIAIPGVIAIPVVRFEVYLDKMPIALCSRYVSLG